MSNSLQYETPENVNLTYRPAGVGTRFVAWLIDNILIAVGLFVLFLVLLMVASAGDGIVRSMFDKAGEVADDHKPKTDEMVVLYAIGIFVIAANLGGIVYFTLGELFWRGQTYGKKICKIRVVKAEGFALDPGSIILRNLFRFLDHLPPLWLVPVVSAQGRRLGDMAAGTIVISDEPQRLSAVRQMLGGRSAAEARYRFDSSKLDKLKPRDFETIEQVLDRWNRMSPVQRFQILNRLLESLCRKMAVEPPPIEERQMFLEDLLAAEFRRQDRRLH